MHFHLPKPLHGWRALVGEIAIIVVGVLIALGAEQLVEAAHWREEVGKFRAAVDHELGRNIGIYAGVIAQRPCVDRNLADLERFLRDSAAGRTDKLLRPIGRPFYQSQYFSVWDNKGGDVTQHLPMDARIRYSELYDEFRNNDAVRSRESEVWRTLAQFQLAEPLDHADRMRLRELLSRAEGLNAVTPSNYTYILNLAGPLGLHKVGDPYAVHLADEDEFCQPLIASGGR